MKEHPILFNGEMVRAILGGRKTQSRRPMAPQPQGAFGGLDGAVARFYDSYGETASIRCPFGRTGDHLWVRETFAYPATVIGTPNHLRMADGELPVYCADVIDPPFGYSKWKPSIHMPRWVSRIMLEVTDVRVQRVQDVTDDDAWEEGAWWWQHDDAAGPPFYVRKGYNVECFSELWDSIYAKRGLGWDINPWVFAISFKRITT